MKQQLYGYLPPITNNQQDADVAGEARTNACDVLQRTPTHRRASVGRLARTYRQLLCTDTGYSLEDLPEAMDGRDGRKESEKYVLATRPYDEILNPIYQPLRLGRI